MKTRHAMFAWFSRDCRAFLLATTLLIPLGARSAEPIVAQDTFVHSFSRFAFPTNVGNFRRVNLKKYDKEGRDISAGYNLFTSPLAITVYVYPAPKNAAVLPQQRVQGVTDTLIARHFVQVTNDIFRTKPTVKVRVVKDEIVELKQANKSRKGQHAVLAFEELFGGVVQPVQSEAFLFLLEPDTMFLIDERFYVKVRSTYPASMKAKAETELKEFLDTFAWPTK